MRPETLPGVPTGNRTKHTDGSQARFQPRGSGRVERLNRILHVDDDDDIRAITKAALELIGGFQVAQFATGFDAVKNALTHAPQILLIDVMMPGMNGVQTWENLSRLPGLDSAPAIFVTAKSDKAFSDRLIEKGAYAVVTKPFDQSALIATIRDAWMRRCMALASRG